MSMDFGLLAGAAGCALGVASMFTSARRSRDARLSVERLREETSACESLRINGVDTLKKQFDALQLSMQAAAETLGEGKLTRSARAQALQTLRTGVSPDTAACKLRMPKNDIRLLAKIWNLLSAYR